MATRFCVKLTCTDPDLLRLRDGHEPSYYPRFYVAADWDGKTVARWTAVSRDATPFADAEAAAAALALLRREYESPGERLVVEELTPEPPRPEPREEHQILVFAGFRGAFGMNYLHAADLDDLKAKAKGRGITRCCRYNWDKFDSSGWLAGDYKAVDDLTPEDWAWLTAPVRSDYHMLKPG